VSLWGVMWGYFCPITCRSTLWAPCNQLCHSRAPATRWRAQWIHQLALAVPIPRYPPTRDKEWNGSSAENLEQLNIENTPYRQHDYREDEDLKPVAFRR
jgi:hypothetical protein